MTPSPPTHTLIHIYSLLHYFTQERMLLPVFAHPFVLSYLIMLLNQIATIPVVGQVIAIDVWFLVKFLYCGSGKMYVFLVKCNLKRW